MPNVSHDALDLPATGQVYTFLPGSVWTGAVGTAWSVAGNWTDAVVPTAATNAIVVAAANQPLVTGSQACGYLGVDPGATLTLGANATLATASSTNLARTSTLAQRAGSELRVGQDLGSTGSACTLDPTSLVSFRAAAATTHNLTGTGTVPFQNLSLGAQAAGDQLSIQGTATVQRLLTLAQGATATLAAGGSLALLSNATGTGQIAQDAASAVNGTVTVQRYITPTLNVGAGRRRRRAECRPGLRRQHPGFANGRLHRPPAQRPRDQKRPGPHQCAGGRAPARQSLRLGD